MCEYCGRRIHSSGCPNAEDDVFYICEYCAERISFGAKYVDARGSFFHAGCFFDYLYSGEEEEILETLGLAVEIAGDEEG